MAFSLLPLTSYAVRATGKWTVAKQSDGQTIEVCQCGDEWLHYFLSRDGVALVRSDNGDFCYADCMGANMTSSGITAHELWQRTESEQRLIATLGTVSVAEGYASMMRAKANERRRLRHRSYFGSFRGLVILANFTDKKFNEADPKAFYEQMLNGEGFSMNDSPGSLRDYFLDQSNNQFDLTFDVAGPYTSSYASTDFKTNDAVRRNLIPEMVLNAANDVNFSDYDWDGNGEVDQVFVLYAGYGANEYYDEDESTAAAKGTIWPHEWNLSQRLSVNGLYVYTYACGNELWTNDTYTGLGTFCHEFSHCMGLPDLYDTQWSSHTETDSGGLMDSWEIMDGGNYNHRGWVPPCYSGYERAYCGWTEPEELTASATIRDMMPLSEQGNVYMIVNDCDNSSIDEFYILENRQKTGWDRYVPDHGLLVMHIDYNENVWLSNRVNTDVSHLRYMCIAADNQPFKFYHDNTRMKGITYPYVNTDEDIVNDSLTNTSVPAATVFYTNTKGNKLMNKPVTNISEDSEHLTISFDFMGGDPEQVAVRLPQQTVPSGSPSTAFDLAGRRNIFGKGLYITGNKKVINK